MFTNYFTNLKKTPISNDEISLMKSDYHKYIYLSNLYLEIKYSYTPQVINKDYYDILCTSKAARSKIIFFNPNNVILLSFQDFVSKYMTTINSLSLKDKERIATFEKVIREDLMSNNEKIKYESYKRNLVNVKRAHFLSIFKNLLYIKS